MSSLKYFVNPCRIRVFTHYSRLSNGKHTGVEEYRCLYMLTGNINEIIKLLIN